MRFLLLLLTLCVLSACKEKDNPITSDPDLVSDFGVISVDYTPLTGRVDGVDVEVAFVKWGDSLSLDAPINIWVTLIDVDNQRFTGNTRLRGVQGGGHITRVSVLVFDASVDRIRLYEVAFKHPDS